MRTLTLAALAVLVAGPLAGQQKPVYISSFDTKMVAQNAAAGQYNPAIRLQLMMGNSTGEHVTSWRGTLVARDPFGDVMFRVQLTAGRANLPADRMEQTVFEFEDNEFIDDQPYDYLTAYDVGNLDLELTDVQVVH